MATRYRLHGRVRASQKAYRCLLSLPHSHRETVGIPLQAWAGGESAGRVGPCVAAAWQRDLSGGSAEVDVGDSGGGEAQGSAGGVGEEGQHVEGGQAAAAGLR